MEKQKLLIRLELLKSRTGVDNKNIIRKIERQFRKCV